MPLGLGDNYQSRGRNQCLILAGLDNVMANGRHLTLIGRKQTQPISAIANRAAWTKGASRNGKDRSDVTAACACRLERKCMAFQQGISSFALRHAL